MTDRLIGGCTAVVDAVSMFPRGVPSVQMRLTAFFIGSFVAVLRSTVNLMNCSWQRFDSWTRIAFIVLATFALSLFPVGRAVLNVLLRESHPKPLIPEHELIVRTEHEGTHCVTWFVAILIAVVAISRLSDFVDSSRKFLQPLALDLP